MALSPAFRCFVVAGTHDSPHTLDVFLDYTCPFSRKIFNSIETILKPCFTPGGRHAGKVKIIIRLQPQPWHAQSTFTHEAALAVARVSPESFWTFSKLLFEHQTEYFDIPTRNLTPLQIRANLAGLASQVLTHKQVEQFKDLLVDKGTPNGGIAVTSDLKYHVKFARQNGIHVSPTVMWDGLVEPEVSSGWDEEKWVQFLDAKIIV